METSDLDPPWSAELIYQTYRERVFAVCEGQLHDRAAAEDLVQETFLRSAPYLDRLSGDAFNYLATVARNLCRHERARRRRWSSTGEDNVDQEPTAGLNIEDVAVDRAFIRDVWMQLSIQDRLILAYHISGFSANEIAERTGRTPNAVALAVSRARRRARKFAGKGWELIAIGAALNLHPGIRRAHRPKAASPAKAAALLNLALVALLLGRAGQVSLPHPQFNFGATADAPHAIAPVRAAAPDPVQGSQREGTANRRGSGPADASAPVPGVGVRFGPGDQRGDLQRTVDVILHRAHYTVNELVPAQGRGSPGQA